MKNIKINFTDFDRSLNPHNNYFIDLLRRKYSVEISDKPDYIIYSAFGRRFLDYDCVKIYYTGECIVPDFNLCDYAIGFEYMTYGDRYIRIPLYELFHWREKYISVVTGSYQRRKKTDFCSFVCSNDRGMKERFKMFDLLNKYKKVDSGGRYMNNIGGPVKDKLEFDGRHKFSIAFENCSQMGYTTEKIAEAFAADTIPIYYGNPEIAKEFNTKAFINVHDYPSLEAAAARVIEIDSDNDLYNSIKNEPILSGARYQEEDICKFLYNIFDQPLEKARRRPYNTRIQEIEDDQKLCRAYEKIIGEKYKAVKSILRRIKNHSL